MLSGMGALEAQTRVREMRETVTWAGAAHERGLPVHGEERRPGLIGEEESK